MKLSELKEKDLDIYKLAVNNMKAQSVEHRLQDPKETLGWAFTWKVSKEGYDFWNLVQSYKIEQAKKLLTALPEPSTPMFLKGQYIVTLIDKGNCGKKNYCFKQRTDGQRLKPEIDTRGLTDNGNSYFLSTDKSQTRWRFATEKEAAEYEKQGKPYDVTTLKKSEDGKILSKSDLIEGEIYVYDDINIALYPRGGSLHEEIGSFTLNESWLWVLDIKPATEEQKEHLRACIAAGKYVPKEEVNKVPEYVEGFELSTSNEESYNCLDIGIGDTVRCIGNNKSKFNPLHAGSGWVKDLEFRVTKIGKEKFYNVYWGGNKENGVYSDCVELVSKVNSAVKKERNFIPGDYIVILRNKKLDTEYIKYGYCFKQRDYSDYFEAIKDLNGFYTLTSIKFEQTSLWRYATQEEIDEYNKLDKPFDTVAFNKSKQKHETVLDKWLRETKARNLSLNALEDFIASKIATPESVYKELKGYNSMEKAEILYEKWNPEYKELPKKTLSQEELPEYLANIDKPQISIQIFYVPKKRKVFDTFIPQVKGVNNFTVPKKHKTI